MATNQLLFEPQVTLSDDPFWPTCRIFIDIFQYKPTKLLLKLMLLWLTTLIILQTVILLQVFDGVYFITYFTTYSGTFLIWMTIQSSFQFNKSVSFCTRNLLRWDITSAGPSVEKIIRKEIFYENVFVIVTVLVSLCTATLHLVPAKNDKDFFLVLVVFEKFFPMCETLLSVMFRANFLVLSVLYLAPFHMITYYVGHVRIQFKMFVNCLHNLNSGYELDLSKCVDEEEYQKEITRRLKFCIERHIRIYSSNNRFLNDIHVYIFVFSVIATVYGTGLVVYAVSFQASLSYLRVISLCCAYILTFIHTIWAGQISEDVTSQMFEALKQAEWYHWNNKNKKMYLMLLLNGEKEFKLQYSENVSINYELGVSILKSIYSIITILNSLKNGYYSERI